MDFIRAGRDAALPGLTLAAACLLLWSAEPARDRSRAGEVVLRPAASEARALAAYARLPLTFVENAGQTDARVRYYGGGAGYGFYFTPQGVVFSFVRGSPPAEHRQVSARGESYEPAELNPDPPAAEETAQGVALGLRFVGANPHPILEGATPAPGTVNYLIGSDPARWRTGLATYEEVVYRELWPGIDMRVRGRGGELKYEFVLRPGARVEDIRLAYDGAQGLSLGPSGDLLIETVLGTLRDSRPESYQRIGGRRVAVESRYVLADAKGSAHGFAVAGYDPAYPLVIDPGLVYSTFFARSISSIAVDALGNAYLTGSTGSPDFPTTPGAFDRTCGTDGQCNSDPLCDGGCPREDVFVAKLNSMGSALLYSTFLGGSSFDHGFGIAVDADGNTYVTGQTISADFPTTPGAFDRTCGTTTTAGDCGQGFAPDGFVAKLNAAGSALLYSTFLGGSLEDIAGDIEVDDLGSAYVTGQTISSNFPTTADAFDRTCGTDGNCNRGDETEELSDVFVTKLNAAGSVLVYSTFLGGRDGDGGFSIAVDRARNAYVTGITSSPDFPTNPGAFDPTFNGGPFNSVFDGFVAKLNAAGSALVYSTFLGGSSGLEVGTDIAVDAERNAYVTGLTYSTDFPTTPGAFDRTCGSQGRCAFDDVFSVLAGDAFVSSLNANGSALAYSTYLGGRSTDFATGLAVDAMGNVTVAGSTNSPDFPTTPSAFDETCGIDGNCDFASSGFAQDDAFVAQLNTAGSALRYSTYLGGGQGTPPALDRGFDLALDGAGNAYVVGFTSSRDFPTTPGAFDTTFDDPQGSESFVTKLTLAAAGAVCAGLAATQAGTPGDDVLIGTTGPDVINGLGGRDRIEGRGGDDVLCGGAEADLLVGGNGADRLYGQAGNDGLDGGAGDDLLSGAAGEDVLVGGLDDDTLEGDEADDRLEGGDGFDRLDGGDGNDLLRGGRGLDVLYGGLGRDQLFGQEEGDVVNGGPANDLLSGGSGNDRLGGQAGNDQLFGDDGDDRMDGGTDGDVCSGGPHAAGDTAVNCEVVNGVP